MGKTHLHEMEHYYVPGVIENGKKTHLCGMKKTVNRSSSGTIG